VGGFVSRSAKLDFSVDKSAYYFIGKHYNEKNTRPVDWKL